jgi:hypothetical protein
MMIQMAALSFCIGGILSALLLVLTASYAGYLW